MIALRGPPGACRLPASGELQLPGLADERAAEALALRSRRAGSTSWHRSCAPPRARCWSTGRCAGSSGRGRSARTRRRVGHRCRRLDQKQAQLRRASMAAPLASSRRWTRKTQPRLMPSRSAIQQASRAASNGRRNPRRCARPAIRNARPGRIRRRTGGRDARSPSRCHPAAATGGARARSCLGRFVAPGGR